MKYIYRKFVKDLDLSELDFENQDAVLGHNRDGHEYNVITEKAEGCDGYHDEQEEIEIDFAIKNLQELKKAGANYAQIMAHVDHHGYEFYGLEMREATKEEVDNYLNKDKESIKKFKKAKIELLEAEIEKLKK
jgi:hypothetical protein